MELVGADPVTVGVMRSVELARPVLRKPWALIILDVLLAVALAAAATVILGGLAVSGAIYIAGEEALEVLRHIL